MVDADWAASAGDGHRTGADLCVALVERLPVSGASISVIGQTGQAAIGASDDIAARVEELQFELGEGPHWVASRTAEPVLVPDLRTADHSLWPVFGTLVSSTGAAALFAVPIVLGAVTIGVVDMYRATPGTLDASVVQRALAMARLVGPTALQLAALPDSPVGPSVPGMRREVHQATGMVLVQLRTSAAQALARLQAHAFSHGRSLEWVAHEVVARRLDFRDEAD